MYYNKLYACRTSKLVLTLVGKISVTLEIWKGHVSDLELLVGQVRTILVSCFDKAI